MSPLLYHDELYLHRMSFSIIYHLYFHLHLNIPDSSTVVNILIFILSGIFQQNSCDHHNISDIFNHISCKYLLFHIGNAFAPISSLLYNQLIFLHHYYPYIIIYHDEFYMNRISFYLLHRLHFHPYHHIYDSLTIVHLYSTVG